MKLPLVNRLSPLLQRPHGPKEELKAEPSYLSNLLRISLSADQRGSSMGSAQEHGSAFRFAPQCGHKPLQSSRQITFTGTASSTCSRKASSSSTPFPS